jgi:ELWxxDGT repeat protein
MSGMGTRLGALLAALSLTLLPAIPTSAADISAVHLELGEVRESGCPTLEVWNGTERVTVIEPWGTCGYRTRPYGTMVQDHRAVLGSTLVFTWSRSWWDGNYASGTTSWVWATDGSVAGTRRLFAARSVVDMGGSCCHYTIDCHETWLPTGSRLFVATDCTGDPEAGPATRARVIRVVEGGRNAAVAEVRPNRPADLAVAGNRLFLTDINRHHGRELWVVAGTPPRLRLVRDLRPGPKSARIRVLSVCGSGVRFTADDGHGRAWWVSDGTAAGTHRLRVLRCPWAAT